MNRSMMTFSEGEGKRALVFWPYNALGLRTGAHQVQVADLKALMGLGYEVTVCCSTLFCDPDTSWDLKHLTEFEKKTGVKFHLHQADDVDRLFHLHQTLIDPEGWGHFHSPWLAKYFLEVFRQVNPELLVINYPLWGKLAMGKEFGTATRILRSFDFQSRNHALINTVNTFLDPVPHPFHADPRLLDENLFFHMPSSEDSESLEEFKIYDQYDCTVGIAPIDVQMIQDRTEHTALGLVPPMFSPVSVTNSYAGAPLVVMSTYPLNIQGYLYFTGKVLPEILTKIPDFTLHVVGGVCEKVKGVSGIELLGYVDDLTALYAQSPFSICPLLGGTGIQIKILESMAHGVPVIAMEAVGKASPIQHGVNGLVASNAKEFAECAIRLFQDRELCRKLGQAARMTIANEFSLEKGIDQWEDAISLAKNKTRALRKWIQADPLKSGSAKIPEERLSQYEANIGGMLPKISVVTPTLNCAKYLRGCIESVLAQNYENFEHIIVDGASTDETLEILKDYPHVSWISEPDHGEAEALNKALAMAQGDIISWLNADDSYFGRDVFRIVAAEMDSRQGRHLVYGKTLLTDEDQTGAWLQIPRDPITLPVLMKWFELIELYQPSMFYSKELVQTVGRYREDLFFSIDYEYWLRIAAKGFSFHFVDQVLSTSRLFRSDGKSALSRDDQANSWQETATSFQEHLSPVQRINFWKDYYRYQLPYFKQSKEPIVPPDDPWAKIGLAFVLRGCGLSIEVAKLLQDVTPESRGASDSYWLLGDALLRSSNDIDAANFVLEKAKGLAQNQQVKTGSCQSVAGLSPQVFSCGANKSRPLDPALKTVPLVPSHEKNPGSERKPLKVLFQNRPNANTAPGGDTVVMRQLKRGLEQRGVHVDISLGRTSPVGYDLVHLFNFSTPDCTEQYAKDAVQAGIPFVVTPLFEDWPRFLSKCAASYDLFKQYVESHYDEQKFSSLMSLLRALPSTPHSDNSYTALHAASIFATGEIERKRLLEVYPDIKRVDVVKFGMDHVSVHTDPDLFFKKYGFRDYVLCVGRLEARKNQLMVLKALQHEEFPVVFVTGGVTDQQPYEDLCRRFPRKAPTLFLGRLSDEMLASCYLNARVFCLASWYELPGLVTIEAARFGCAVVATSWGTLQDYLPQGVGVHYCEPDDPDGIRDAILQGWNVPPPTFLQQQAEQFTWARSIEQLLNAYRGILDPHREVTTQEHDLTSRALQSQLSLHEKVAAHLTHAQSALEQGQLDAAKQYLEQLFQQDPTHAAGWLMSGILAMQHQNFREAVEAFGKSLRYGGNARKCRIGLAMALLGQGSERQSQKVLLEVLADHPDDEEAIHWLIRACTAVEDWEALERSLSCYLQRNPANINIRFTLASVQVRRENKGEAQSQLQMLQLLNPDFAGLEDLKHAIEKMHVDLKVVGAL